MTPKRAFGAGGFILVIPETAETGHDRWFCSLDCPAVFAVGPATRTREPEQ